jgi:16S rRNA (cytidine1402-2'-O)-methyltransferase
MDNSTAPLLTPMSGTLFVVATPIGNLEDLSFRALRTLKEVDLIAAEDTRRTAKLLAHYEIRRPMVSLREHNESRETPRLVERLVAGDSIALVSDAGTPGIADPGARFVRAAREATVQVIPIPGPSAVTAALSASGFTADRFVFLGFPPASGVGRDRWFDELAKEPRTAVFFEAPHRIRRTVRECRQTLGERPIVLFRELTKSHEESVYSPNDEVRELGEFCIVVSPLEMEESNRRAKFDQSDQMVDLVGYLTNIQGVDSDLAVAMAARAFDLTQRAAAKLIKKHRYLVKRQTESPA